eukprot:SAG11_NODE_5842_length_1450_cov_1.779423_2_plen_161_part_00
MTRLQLQDGHWVSLVSKSGLVLFKPETEASTVKSRWGDAGVAAKLMRQRALDEGKSPAEGKVRTSMFQTAVPELEASAATPTTPEGSVGGGADAALKEEVEAIIDAGFTDLENAVRTNVRLRQELEVQKEAHETSLTEAVRALTPTASDKCLRRCLFKMM